MRATSARSGRRSINSDHYRFEQIADGAWAALAIDSGAGVGNAGIADLGGRSLVVDCGFTPRAARDLRAFAEETVGPVERLFVTHADFDHYGGAHAFADLPILATEQTAATIAEAGPGRISGMQEQMDGYIAELEEKGAPEAELEQARRIATEAPGLELALPTESFAWERDLGGAVAYDCGAAHTASDAVVWLSGPRVLLAGDLVTPGNHPNLTRGHPPENWLSALGRFEALGPEHVVGGHGPVAGPDAIAAARGYIETVVALAATRGEHEIPAAYADWDFAEGFQQNIAALRAR